MHTSFPLSFDAQGYHLAPLYSDSTSKTMFLSWLLREIASFRSSEAYGQDTSKEALERKERQKAPLLSSQHQQTGFLLSFFADLAINCVFFGIPHAYRAQIKVL